MILQALVKLAENEKLIADPDFEFRPVAWIVTLTDDGSVIKIEDNRLDLNAGKADKKGKPIKPKLVGKDSLIPLFPTGRSGTKPKAAFLVDMAKFVFGIDPGVVEKDDSFLDYVTRFRELVAQCEKTTGDINVESVRKMLDRVICRELIADLPTTVGPSDLFMFRVGLNEPVHSQPSVRNYWKKMRAILPADSSIQSNLRCLVSGHPIVGEVPRFPPISGVPGSGTMGSGLVAMNGPSARTWWSYGLEGNQNAPISRFASETAAVALNRLADLRPTNGKGERLPIRRIPISSDTLIVFWSPDSIASVQSVLDAMPNLLNPSEEATDVGNMLISPKTGVFRPLESPGRFYALTLTGTQGRIIVRDWIETSVQQIQMNLRSHFSSLACVRNTPPSKGQPPREVLSVSQLMASLSARGRDVKVPAALASDFVHAALRGTPYPRSILQRALLRERAEVTNDEWDYYVRRDARASLIKAVLMRDPEFYTDLENQMDESRNETGYWLGALLAVLEDTQRLASGGVNSSIKDKFYGAASATPAAVFPTMMDLFHKHTRKARDAKPGATTIREKRVDTILNRIDEIPVHLDLKQQALFVLGYHHQRYALFNKSGEEPTLESPIEKE